MPGKRGVGPLLGEERGAVLALVALCIVMLLSAVALAVDLGLLMSARTESQRVADLSALAGAGSLILFPGDETRAREEAIKFAGENTVRGDPAVVLPEDVDVLLDEEKVRVRVHNIESRGNPIPMIFARVFGRDVVDVSTVAAAEVSPAGAATCLLPVALPDRWHNEGDFTWDPSEGDYYIPWPEPGFTSYTDDHIGMVIELKASTGAGHGGSSHPGDVCVSHPAWRCWWQPDGGPAGGPPSMEPYILGCPQGARGWSVGDELTTQPGSVQATTILDFTELIAMDPGAQYDDDCKCILGGSDEYAVSPRLRAVPVIRSDQVTGDGVNVTAPIVSFAGVFIESVGTSPSGGGPPGLGSVWARFMGFSGFDPREDHGATSEPLIKTLRLVE